MSLFVCMLCVLMMSHGLCRWQSGVRDVMRDTGTRRQDWAHCSSEFRRHAHVQESRVSTCKDSVHMRAQLLFGYTATLCALVLIVAGTGTSLIASQCGSTGRQWFSYGRACRSTHHPPSPHFTQRKTAQRTLATRCPAVPSRGDPRLPGLGTRGASHHSISVL